MKVNDRPMTLDELLLEKQSDDANNKKAKSGNNAVGAASRNIGNSGDLDDN